MHAIQGAMAIRRERTKREQKRQSQIRRLSGKTASPRSSDVSEDQRSQLPVMEPPKPPKADTSMTAFHLGVVFILLGLYFVYINCLFCGKTDILDKSQQQMSKTKTFLLNNSHQKCRESRCKASKDLKNYVFIWPTSSQMLTFNL